MRNTFIVAALTCLALAGVLAGPAQANLLTNGGFEASQYPCSSGWTRWSPAVLMPPPSCKTDGTAHPPQNPTLYEGRHYGTTDYGYDKAAESHIYQVVTVVANQELHLTGYIYGGTSVGGYVFFARILNGATLTSPVLATLESTMPGWHQVDLRGTPTGTQVVVEWGFSGTIPINWGAVATHADAFDLTQASATCTGEPTVTSLSQDFGAADTTVTGLQISGTGFDSTCQVKFQGSGLPDIEAVNESASPDGTTLTCDVPLAGAAMGQRNLVITKTNCNGLTINNAFLVVMATLTNGSFEDPTAPPSCPNPPTAQGAPSGWLEGGLSTETTHLRRDSDQYPPSCPRPDGDHYASVVVPIGVSFDYWAVFQYVAVTPGQQITLSGMFAGGGRTTVELQIRDGNENGNVLGSRTIERRRGCPPHGYNWVPASVSATPSKGYVTVVWRTHAEQGTFGVEIVNSAHADNLVLTVGGPPPEVCGNGIDDDGDRRIDCQDPDCAAEPGCATPPAEICGNGVDDDGDRDIDCDDSDCAASCVEICNNLIDDDGDCQVDEGCTEICNNGIDDNNNGLTDCADPECAASPLCAEICDNGIDDNNDGLVDCYDPVCTSFAACQCNDPKPDSDGDKDVDMDDFAAFQRCVTATAAFAQGCICFDGDRDGDVDDQDVVRLIYCASGSKIDADPACDNN